MKYKLFVSLILLSTLGLRAQDWNALNRRPYPQWFSDAKLGIFVHWGLYSVPAYASKEGYAEWLYKGLLARDPGRMRAMSYFADTTLPVREMYAQLTRHWHAELWKPADWARLFRQAGARYVVLVTKHHDGYSLWDDPYQPTWNSVASGPKRNIVAELTDAVRAEGLTMGFYYSLPEWSNPLHRWTLDPHDSIGRYVDTYMIPQFKHLVSTYKPELIFADGDWDFTADQLRSAELIDWYYRTLGPSAIVNDRWGITAPGIGKHGFRTPEYSAGISDTTRPWAECRGIGRSFGLNRNEDLENYLTPTELIHHFCELVAHGGGLTLNVGPYADGTIPLIQQERLLALGQWLEVNGEAIYGTRPHAIPCHRVSDSASLPPSPIIDFDWVRNAPLKGMPVDNFEIRWEGSTASMPPVAGEYTIRIEGNDEVWLTWGKDTLHYNHAWAENNNQATVNLNGDSVLVFKLHYREKDLESTVRVSWSSNGGRTFSPIYADWHGTASWQRTLRCFTQKDGNLYAIEFDRPGQTLALPEMPKLKRGAIITLLGTTGHIPWQQRRDGTLVLDLSVLNHHEINALNHAWVFKIKN